KFFELQREHQGRRIVTIDMNQIRLAQFLCVTRSSLVETLNRMRNEGKIDYTTTRVDMKVTLNR
ncbi:MAG: helix-turn-helix domain-containing protein, partial [Clostridiales Family XIII bacterium]|nr:helix-turn-helix domain-containing protein [Clostridiales Family XIII bacterium]